MSFIVEDKNLVKKLFKIGQQNTSGIASDPTLNLNVLESLINNLEKNVNQTDSGFISNRPNTQLYTKDLENAYNFLHFLARNQIRESIDGKPLCFGHTEGNLEQELKFFTTNKLNINEYFKYPKTAPDSDNFLFWIHKDGIIDFLSSLDEKSSDKNSGGDLMRVMTDKLISEINNNSDQNISPKSPENKPQSKLDKNLILDGIPNPIDQENPYVPGNNPITVGDLESDQKFKQWANAKNIQIVENGKSFPTANRENICKLISYIYKRAENYKDYKANTAQLKELFEYYFNQISKIAQGNNCPVGQGAGQNKDKDKPGKDDKQSPDRKERGSGAGGGNRNFDQLIRYLPLRTDVINLDRIATFFRFVEENLVEEDTRGDYRTKFSQLGSQVASLRNSIEDMADSNHSREAINFSLSSHPNDIIDILGKQNQRRYNEFLQKYIEVVRHTSSAVSLLTQALEGMNISEANLYYLKAQIGWGGSEASSIAYQNYAALRQLSNNVTQAIRKVDTGKLGRF